MGLMVSMTSCKIYTEAEIGRLFRLTSVPCTIALMSNLSFLEWEMSYNRTKLKLQGPQRFRVLAEKQTSSEALACREGWLVRAILNCGRVCRIRSTVQGTLHS